MTARPGDEPVPRRAAARLTWRLLALLLLVFAAATAMLALIMRQAFDSARAQQLADARTHFSARMQSLDEGWRQSAYAIGQQLELWQAGTAGQSPEVRDARLRALLLTLLDQGDFAHALISTTEGRELLRHGTRSQFGLPPGATVAGKDAGNSTGWAHSARDRTVYRSFAGPLRYGDQTARLTLYVPLDQAILARLVYPSTHLDLIYGGKILAAADVGVAASTPDAVRAQLTLAWDAAPGAPLLQIERSFAAPLSPLGLLLIFAASAAALLGAGWLVLGRWMHALVRRLHVMQQAATDFALEAPAPGDIARRLELLAGDPDDIGLLARKLREMMDRIAQARAEQAAAQAALAALNTALESRVSERTRELELARDAALAAARAKEQFLSNMSHEIRTPMNGMLGALELLSGMNLNERQARYIEVAATSGEALLDIINEVLDFAKIGADQMQLAREPIDLNAIARSVTTLFSASAQRKAIELRLEADAGLSGWRLGDALRLRQVLMNLVGNALKFTQRGEIVVRTRRLGAGTNERVAFEVADTGPGIDASQHDRIFEAFMQADHPGRHRQSGTGLGLAISRQLVRAMGGELMLTSAVGAGSTFAFELAFEPASALPPAATGGAGQPHAHQPLSGSVLLVEDNSVNQLIGAAMLEQLGLQVVLAENGEQALARLAQGSVAAVLMDCQMPVMDGYEATHRLRELERLHARPRMPVIALTANALSGDVDRCLASGMDAHLAKPFTLAQLRATLAPWVARVAEA